MAIGTSDVPMRWRRTARTIVAIARIGLCIAALAAFSRAVVALDDHPMRRASTAVDRGRFRPVRRIARLSLARPVSLVSTHAELHLVLEFAYRSSIVQLIAVPFVLASTRRHDDLAEFIALSACALLTVVLVSNCRDRRAACDTSDLIGQRCAAGPCRFPQF
ncbi:hypothetical protein [Burkholderia pyrrocinia]|uniref:hypothetical protein n=1 Tax=Burkholderia pyrrocinia TaxID=60550 RepID=UPI001160AFF2|nr:hypothetical protein [Burkholderia pyrrocinia]